MRKTVCERRDGECKMEKPLKAVALVAFALVFLVFVSLTISAANPSGIDKVQQVSNSTKGAASAGMVNISGGYISTFNVTARIQDPRWKGFIGNVTGSFTLTDASGATLYDWQLASLTGRIYATRNSSTINWSGTHCANLTTLNGEAAELNLTNPTDTLNRTFNTSATLSTPFYVGGNLISGTCPTLNTYVNNQSQSATFLEVALYSNPSIIYTSILEQGAVGYNGNKYDFQEIVPEDGTPGFGGSTAYYLYIELGV